MALWEHVVSEQPSIDLCVDKDILGGLKTQSIYLTVDVVSNLRKSLPDNIAKVRAINYWVKKGKEFITKEEQILIPSITLRETCHIS